jgi:hypothetical protein
MRTTLSAAQAVAAATEDRWPPTYDELGATFPSGHLRWSQSEIARTLSSAFAVDVLFPQATSPDD